MKNTYKKYFFIVALLVFSQMIFAQYHVDKNGVLRNSKNNEATFFGFNYLMPFAHEYRMHTRMGIDHKAAIDRDVFQMSRLGINAYRIHVFDVEISDSVGNLIDNDHLDLLDYTIAQLAKRGIKTTVTCIAFWGNGWPEPDDKTLPGFSNKIDKSQATWNKATVQAHKRYITQLMEHKNRYTGYTYAADPSIVAVEINNEPHQTDIHKIKQVRDYVNLLAKAIRETGCQKPILYNVSENPLMIESYLTANINGITFQWYPSGLVSGHARTENFLPEVSHYNIPFVNDKGYDNKAKFIYEFDAADVGASYMYPAMARSFREAGFQWATQFAYDPYYMAHANTGYQTHYINLAFTPAKAVSFRIAAAAFLNLKRDSSYGNYPENSHFGDFTVDFGKDLSLLNCDTIFAYSNNTDVAPENLSALKEIDGCGSSPVVQYDGTGAYFFNKIGDGLWRLEIYPDALWIDNPFQIKNDISRKVSVLQNNRRKMAVNLPNLGRNFRIECLSNRNIEISKADSVSFYITPGVWLLRTKRYDKMKPVLPDSVAGRGMREWFDCPTTVSKTHVVLNTPLSCGIENQTIKAQIISPDSIISATLVGGIKYGEPLHLEMTKGYGFDWTAEIPAEDLQQGYLEYNIVVTTTKKTLTFPDGVEGTPHNWNYLGKNVYKTMVGRHELLNADATTNTAELMWRPGMRFGYPVDGLSVEINDTTAYKNDGGFVLDASRHKNLDQCTTLSITAQTDGKQTVKIVLLDNAGYGFQKTIQIGSKSDIYTVLLKDFEPYITYNVRQAYPAFAIKPIDTPKSHKLQAGQLNDVVILPVKAKENSKIIFEKIEIN